MPGLHLPTWFADLGRAILVLQVAEENGADSVGVGLSARSERMSIRNLPITASASGFSCPNA
jgi:hypothetical protein